MKQDDILGLFRRHAEEMTNDASVLNAVIRELAQLLADSRGRITKENFETLVRIGGALYKLGDSRFQAKSDVDTIMKQSLEDESGDRNPGRE